ncbi:MAG: phosphatase PAP2 family protein [Ruminococcaceae bacterium]|nr:phosphatase PAP2 family protein [Oscillospiraceae bacterium]
MNNILNIIAEKFDLPILDWIAANIWCPFLDIIMPYITLLGDAGIFWIACALIMMLIPKYRKAGFKMGLALILGLLLCNVTLKPLVARIRPYDYQLEHFGKEISLLISAQHDFSFPSGHTIASFEAATALYICHKKEGIAALILAAVIAFSRIYLYVHYPTDVIASVVFGIALAYVSHKIIDMLYLKLQKSNTLSDNLDQ